MEVKEAIEFMELYKYNHINEPCQEEEGINEVISLLQQGEKYRQMWEELDDSLEPEGNPDYPDDIGDYNAVMFMKHIKQKYFPKEASQGEE